MIREGGALLTAARHLTPWIAEHAQSFERARRLPASVIEQLRELGVFRLFVPRMYGGLECDQPTSLRLFEELATADASVGFNSVVWSHALAYVTALPSATLDAVYAEGPDVIWTNSLIVGGEARAVSGGYRISGHWPLVSGCELGWIGCSFGVARRIRPRRGCSCSG